MIRGIKQLGYVCAEAFTPTEAARWYLKAMDQNDSDAASSLASLYLDHTEVAAVLPPETRQVLVRAAQDTKNDPATCPKQFPREIASLRLSSLNAEIALKKGVASQYHDLALAYRDQHRRDDYRQALSVEYELLGQRLALKPTDWQLKSDQAKVAVELGQSYQETKETDLVVRWTTRAADLGHTDSLLKLADWYEKGTGVKADARKASHYAYLGRYAHGVAALSARRYDEALADLKKVCESAESDADDHDKLGQCYGKLRKWDEAVTAYTRSIELDLKREQATSVVENLLEALTCIERPEQLLQFVETIEKKGWKPPTEGPNAARAALSCTDFGRLPLK